MAARRRRARVRILGPVLGRPAGDRPLVTPQRVPAADVLAGHPELSGDLGLGVAGGKQRPGLHADALERLAVAQAAGVAAVSGWSHTRHPARTAQILSSEGASLFKGR